MSMQTIMRILWAISICATGLAGCECATRKDGTPDTIEDELRRIQLTMKYPDAKTRIAAALSLRQNDVLDCEPVLIVAGLVADRREGESPFLRVAVYDEDKDILGAGVCEERNVVDGQGTSLVEEYPVFAHDRLSGVLSYLLVPVEVRDSDQRKDDERWQGYVLGSKSYESPPRGSTGESKTPPMYISIPEPNDVAVWVYVYDRSGNKSDPVRLQNAMASEDGKRWPLNSMP